MGPAVWVVISFPGNPDVLSNLRTTVREIGLCCGALAFHCDVIFSHCRPTGSRPVGFSSCSTWVQFLPGPWDLPGTGIEPVSSVLQVDSQPLDHQGNVMSDSVRPHRWQPTRLPHPWDSQGKNTGVGCHFLLQCRKVKSERCRSVKSDS